MFSATYVVIVAKLKGLAGKDNTTFNWGLTLKKEEIDKSPPN